MTTRVALVTGGIRGIGAAVSKALAADGHKVIAAYDGNHERAKAFNAETGIPIYSWDVADFAACQRGVAEVVSQHGDIDILVSNAGIIADKMLHRMTEEEWHRVIHVNLNGCFNMCHAVIGRMRDRGWGRIINTSSVNALRGCMGQTNYSASKAGIIGFTKSLALESAAKGITVNAIAPGYIATEMTSSMPDKIKEAIVATIPVGRMGDVEDIARAVVFLASEGAGYITGATLSVNGGMLME
jgi:acetoacetyl-CoA reductase